MSDATLFCVETFKPHFFISDSKSSTSFVYLQHLQEFLLSEFKKDAIFLRNYMTPFASSVGATRLFVQIKWVLVKGLAEIPREGFRPHKNNY